MRRRRPPPLLAPAAQARGAHPHHPCSCLYLQANPSEAFALWQEAHGKSYKSSREAARRREVFVANAAHVAKASVGSVLPSRMPADADATHLQHFGSLQWKQRAAWLLVAALP